MRTIPIRPVSDHGLEPVNTCSTSSLFALQVLDESMAPEFKPGHVVVVDSSARLKPGSFVLARVVRNESESTSVARLSSVNKPTATELGVLRRWQPVDGQNVVLEALNRSWANETVDMRCVNVLGVVIQRAARRRKDRTHYR